MLSIRLTIFNVSIVSSSLHVLPLIVPTLLQIIEITNVLLKIYDVLGL